MLLDVLCCISSYRHVYNFKKTYPESSLPDGSEKKKHLQSSNSDTRGLTVARTGFCWQKLVSAMAKTGFCRSKTSRINVAIF
jgi:hypothetical protein